MTSRTITTSAVAQRETTPDSATVEALALGEGDSPADARTDLRDHASALRSAITAVAATAVETTDVKVRDTDDMFDCGSDAAYRAEERFRIECDPETVSAVVVDVTDADGTVRSVEFAVGEREHRRLQDEAIAAATERAREKAERIAAAAGQTVGEPLELHHSEDSPNTGTHSLVEEAIGGASSTDLHPKPLSVTADVEAVYELQ